MDSLPAHASSRCPSASPRTPPSQFYLRFHTVLAISISPCPEAGSYGHGKCHMNNRLTKGKKMRGRHQEPGGTYQVPCTDDRRQPICPSSASPTSQARTARSRSPVPSAAPGKPIAEHSILTITRVNSALTAPQLVAQVASCTSHSTTLRRSVSSCASRPLLPGPAGPRPRYLVAMAANRYAQRLTAHLGSPSTRLTRLSQTQLKPSRRWLSSSTTSGSSKSAPSFNPLPVWLAAAAVAVAAPLAYKMV